MISTPPRPLLSLVPVVLLALPAAVLIFPACPKGECEKRNDCPSGQICSADYTCVKDPGGGGGGHINNPPGNDAGPNNDVDEVSFNLDDPPTMLFESPTAGEGLVAISGGSVDRILSFDLLANDPPIDLVFDLSNAAIPGNRCALDSVVVFDTTFTLEGQDETWFSCRQPSPAVFIRYDEQQNLYETDISGLDVFAVFDSNDNTNFEHRVLYARRDGLLRSITFDDAFAADPGVTRPTVDVGNALVPALDPPLEHVVAIYKLVEGDDTLGDIALVFDAGDPKRLVPIQRLENQETWSANINTAVNLAPIELPDDTHYVFFDENVGVLDPIGLTIPDENTPNLAIIRPTATRVKFARYENEVRGVQTSFSDLLYTGSRQAPAVPPATDRVLFTRKKVGAETFYFYALTNTPLVYRFPVPTATAQDRSSEVIGANENQSDTAGYNGLVVADPLNVWVTTRSGTTLRRYQLNANGL
jgi:hypothetical protein